MPTATLAKAKKELDSLLDAAIHSSEPLIIQRPGKPDMAVLPMAELKARRKKGHSDHVLASAYNRKRIEQAFAELDAGKAAWSGTNLRELKEQIEEQAGAGKSTPNSRKGQ
jgi:PHD/YefM family antitoxin component YafN of YafNO toxin-antitoxin module